MINELESNRVFFYFEEISKIPRGSYNEKAICEYLCEFARNTNLEYISDDLYNVIIKKEGTKGYEDAPVVALQGHTDMVCEKNKDVSHDFLKDPIKLIYDGDFLKADRTTLGADNGVAVAMSLAVLEASNISHPPIEAIFTSCEEVGMDGAMGLDTKNLKCDMFINIDSEDEGIFTVGCAGGTKADIEIPISYEEVENLEDFEIYNLGITGLMGGHSGIDIIKWRANSNILLARLLDKILKNIRVCEIFGGSKDNAIPREAEAVILVKKEKLGEISEFIIEFEKMCKDEYHNTDPNLKISFEKCERENISVFSGESIENVISVIITLPNGIRSMSTDVDGLVESSMNVGVVVTSIDDSKVEITASIRSAVSSRKYFIMQQVEAIIKMSGGIVEFRGDYPAWEYSKNSKLRDKCLEVYKELSGKEAKVEIIHAGLECGLFYEKMPNLDIISFGPDLYDIHTPDERASIYSIDRSWKFLQKLLESIKKEN